MTVCRSQMGIAILDGYLYAVGGTNRINQVLQSAERYSFQEVVSVYNRSPNSFRVFTLFYIFSYFHTPKGMPQQHT